MAPIPLSALNSIVINKANRQLKHVFCCAVMVLYKVLYVLLNIQKCTYEISYKYFSKRSKICILFNLRLSATVI